MMPIVIGFDPSIASYGISDGTRAARLATAPGQTIEQRVELIFVGISQFLRDTVPVGASPITFVYEGPTYGVGGASGAFDAGYLRCRFDRFIGEHYGFGYVRVIEVAPSTLKKFASGKGNAKKHDMPLVAFKRYGVEFADDPGGDKLHAFLLVKYGEAVLAGTIEHTPSRARGKGAHSIAGLKKASKTRAGVSA